MQCLLTLLTMLYCTQNLKKRSVIISMLFDVQFNVMSDFKSLFLSTGSV